MAWFGPDDRVSPGDARYRILVNAVHPGWTGTYMAAADRRPVTADAAGILHAITGLCPPRW